MERSALAERLGGVDRTGSTGAVVVTETDPLQFQAAFADAVAGAGPVFLADPGWGTQEREQLQARVRLRSSDSMETGWLAIPTGGSSGQLKLARHDGETIVAAVAGFSQHFGWPVVNAVGVLPLHHVAGLMGWLRCALTGGRYEAARWSEIAAGACPELNGDGPWCLSLVLTQLARLLDQPASVAWLQRFEAVLLGGAAAGPDLLEAAAQAGVRLVPSYGATETLGMAAALRADAFLAGRRDCGDALPHARLRIADDGLIGIEAKSLFRGYWPDLHGEAGWYPGDLGRWSADGGLIIEGRADALINTGGEKVNPTEVEARLRVVMGVNQVVVLGTPDPRWGERVVAVVPSGQAWSMVEMRERLAAELAPYKWPKACVEVASWPVNAMGKVDRAALRRAVSGAVDPGGD